jgi:hypothetical protein
VLGWEWIRCVQELRPACARRSTSWWRVVVLAGLSMRADLVGVSSFRRHIRGRQRFHGSDLEEVPEGRVKALLRGVADRASMPAQHVPEAHFL